jgi:hypothetical protein
MHMALLIIAIVASVVAGYLVVELTHNIQHGEEMKALEAILIPENVQKQVFLILAPSDLMFEPRTFHSYSTWYRNLTP